MPSAKSLPEVIGRYGVVRQLGVGAMGRVLLARDPVLDRHVAIKLLRDDLQIPPEVRDGLIVRMRHEARAAARVTHPNLVVLHDMGEDAALGLFLVFEYLEGPTLKQRLASDKRLSPRAAAKLARELGAALTFAHEKGVLHRDVKPENIILTPTGAKITDFGIARVPDSTLTHAGGLLGTPAYSAPETFRDSKFSAASDQFSLASTLYEAICGSRAFPGDDAVSVAAKIANETPRPIAARLGYPTALDVILLRGMARLAADRFESCEAFGTALVGALGGRAAPEAGLDTTARVSTPPAVPSTPPRERKPWQILLGGLGVVIVAALLVRALLKDRDAALAEAPPPSSAASEEPAPSSAPKPTAPPHGHATSEERPPAPPSAALAPSAPASASAAPTPAPSASASSPPPAVSAPAASATPSTQRAASPPE